MKHNLYDFYIHVKQSLKCVYSASLFLSVMGLKGCQNSLVSCRLVVWTKRSFVGFSREYKTLRILFSSVEINLYSRVCKAKQLLFKLSCVAKIHLIYLAPSPAISSKSTSGVYLKSDTWVHSSASNPAWRFIGLIYQTICACKKNNAVDSFSKPNEIRVEEH